MADRLTKKQRSKNMASIKGKDTKPEMAVRKFLYAQGLRYRLHQKDLPGKPDIVIRRKNTAIFINGCYWHRHKGCKFTYNPKSNIDFWNEKFKSNVERDNNSYKALIDSGWKVIIVWECDIKNNKYQEDLIGKLKG
jgi:DNA mismatch endonuclease, patch repair protein